MKTVMTSVAVLAAAAVWGCSPAGGGGETVAAPACDLAALSAEAAETALAGCGRAWIDANVRLNETQSIGTHNSFKQAIPEAVMSEIAKRNANAAVGLDYEHPVLAVQFDKGARKLELDPYYDPVGGRFSNPLAVRMMAASGATPPPFDAEALAAPGIKVFHTPDIDYWSHCYTLAKCMSDVVAWSDAHPDHAPILIMLNTKSSGVSWEGATEVLAWDKAAFDMMDAEILSVVPREKIITPDEVRGDFPTLREAVLAGNWPTLGKARGRILFAIDNGVETTDLYIEGRPNLTGRLAFPNTRPDAPEAAYFTMNDAFGEGELIRERVAQGFLVRTRADANTTEARTNDRTRLDAALASGAQWVSTDYQTPNPEFGTGYAATLPDGATARCNPVNAAAKCGSVKVD
ncbi:hypothetical protein GC169_02390 [bacterium]|nr:hypothetical protein [bacterium]